MTSRLLPLLVAAAIGLAGCTGPDGGSEGGDQSSEQTHNDADVAFTTEMVPHHVAALRMVDMTQGRDLSPAFERLTEDIEAAQEPEIETMVGWLDDWGVDVPYDGGMGMGGTGGMGPWDEDENQGQDQDQDQDGDEPWGGMPDDGFRGMGPMMSGRGFERLGGAADAAFEAMWLRMMIEHHEGAVELAVEEQQDGQYPPALDLAASIEESQTAEIALMERMLERP